MRFTCKLGKKRRNDFLLEKETLSATEIHTLLRFHPSQRSPPSSSFMSTLKVA